MHMKFGQENPEGASSYSILRQTIPQIHVAHKKTVFPNIFDCMGFEKFLCVASYICGTVMKPM